MREALEALRDDGWSVAIHNDYRQDGGMFTFWLLTHPDGSYVKGEGRTDTEALDCCFAQAMAKAATALMEDHQIDGERIEGWILEGDPHLCCTEARTWKFNAECGHAITNLRATLIIHAGTEDGDDEERLALQEAKATVREIQEERGEVVAQTEGGS